MNKRLTLWLLLALAGALALALAMQHFTVSDSTRTGASSPTAIAGGEVHRTESATPPPSSTATASAPPSPTATPTASATWTHTAPPTSSPTAGGEVHRTMSTPLSTEAILAQAEAPLRDPYALTERLKGVPAPIPRVVNTEPPTYTLGARETFWVSDLEANQNYTISATLRYISPHLYMWVQDGEQVDDTALARSAEAFETQIYPTNRRYFGQEWSPGIDNDVHLTVLNARFKGAAGYFSSADEYPRVVNPYSNQREMFYINLAAKTPGTEDYYSTLAHEFQHMIHWHADPNEETWVNEGAAQVAEELNEYGRHDVTPFLNDPDVQLNSWTDLPSQAGAHYEASYLMISYFLQRFGPDLLREVVQHPANGAAGLTSVLAAHKTGLTFEDIFADWAIANYLDDTTVAGVRYGYKDIEVHVRPTQTHRTYPTTAESTVHQFAADYVELYPENGDVSIVFTGTLTVPAVPNQPHSGRYQWWSNRGDQSDMTLTRAFDLSKLAQVTLKCWLWYDIEEGWDYAYITVSADGGKSWRTLAGRYTTQADPSGQNFGHAYTGLSGGGKEAQWVEEEIDLIPFAGQKILLRFEYITDDAVNHVGFCVDDIRIPQLGYAYNAEQEAVKYTADDGWIAAGFVRMDNILLQRFLVQLITLGRETGVQRLVLDKQGQGRLDIRGFGQDIKRAILVIAGLTPITTEVARYQYSTFPLK